jgi:DNA-directed RNA polymerase specialized sigma subunit
MYKYNQAGRFAKCPTFDLIQYKIRSYYNSLHIIATNKRRIDMLKEQMDSYKPYIDGEIPCGEEEIETAIAKSNEISKQILDIIRVINYIERETIEIKEIIDTSDEKAKQLLELRYLHNKSYRSIGFNMFLSESRIGQLHIEIINKLADKII